jgi:hypothetical protein
MKLKTPHILTLLVIFLATLYLLLGSRCEGSQQVVVISETVCQQPQPTYFGAATIAPPAFPVFGLPTRPLRELGGWRVNYGI